MIDYTTTNVFAITVIAYLVGVIVKMTKLDKNFIPPICGLVGGIVAVIAYLTIPSFPANNLLDGVATGIISGLAATGGNETIQRLIAKLQGRADSGEGDGESEDESDV